jgi:hypothetical protein
MKKSVISRTTCTWKNNSEIRLREVGYETMAWTGFSRVGLNIRRLGTQRCIFVLQNMGSVITICANTNFFEEDTAPLNYFLLTG